MPLSTLPLRPVVWKVVIPVWAAIPAMFVRFTPQPAIRSIRPAACPFSFARSGAPRAALAACPEDRIVRQPRETASSSARNGSRVMSNARWSVTSICPAQAIMRRICARSSSPSGVSAPMTTPFAPRSRKAAISSHISSSSGSV